MNISMLESFTKIETLLNTCKDREVRERCACILYHVRRHAGRDGYVGSKIERLDMQALGHAIDWLTL